MDEGGIDSVSLQSAFPHLHFPNIHVSEEPELSESRLFSAESSLLVSGATLSPQLLITEHSSVDHKVSDGARFSRFSAHLVHQNLLLSTEQDTAKRSRSPSPMWIPGETSTFAEVVRSGSVSRNASRSASPEKPQELQFTSKLVAKCQTVPQTERKSRKLEYKGDESVQSQSFYEDIAVLPVKQKTSNEIFVSKPSTSVQIEPRSSETLRAAEDTAEQKPADSKRSKKKDKGMPIHTEPHKDVIGEKQSVTSNLSGPVETETIKQLSSLKEKKVVEQRRKTNPIATTKIEKEKSQSSRNPQADIKPSKPTLAVTNKENVNLSKAEVDLSGLINYEVEEIETDSPASAFEGPQLSRKQKPDPEKFDISPIITSSTKSSKKKSKNVTEIKLNSFTCDKYDPKGEENLQEGILVETDVPELKIESHQDPEFEYESSKDIVSPSTQVFETVSTEKTINPEYEEYLENGKLIRRVVIKKTIIRSRKIIKSTSEETVLMGEPIVTFEEISDTPVSSSDQISTQITELPTTESTEGISDKIIENQEIFPPDVNLIVSETQPNKSSSDLSENTKSKDPLIPSNNEPKQKLDKMDCSQSHSSVERYAKTHKKPKSKKSKSSVPRSFPFCTDLKTDITLDDEEIHHNNLISEIGKDKLNFTPATLMKNEELVDPTAGLEDQKINLAEAASDSKIPCAGDLEDNQVDEHQKSKKNNKQIVDEIPREPNSPLMFDTSNVSYDTRILDLPELNNEVHVAFYDSSSQSVKEPVYGKELESTNIKTIEESVSRTDEPVRTNISCDIVSSRDIQNQKPIVEPKKSTVKNKSKKQKSAPNIEVKPEPQFITDKSFIDDFLYNERCHDLPISRILDLEKAIDITAAPVDKSPHEKVNLAEEVTESSEITCPVLDKNVSKSTKSSKKHKQNKKWEKSADDKCDTVVPSKSPTFSVNDATKVEPKDSEIESLEKSDEYNVTHETTENQPQLSLEENTLVSSLTITPVSVSAGILNVNIEPEIDTNHKYLKKDIVPSNQKLENDISKKMKKQFKKSKTAPLFVGLDPGNVDSPLNQEKITLQPIEIHNNELDICLESDLQDTNQLKELSQLSSTKEADYAGLEMSTVITSFKKFASDNLLTPHIPSRETIIEMIKKETLLKESPSNVSETITGSSATESKIEKSESQHAHLEVSKKKSKPSRKILKLKTDSATCSKIIEKSGILDDFSMAKIESKKITDFKSVDSDSVPDDTPAELKSNYTSLNQFLPKVNTSDSQEFIEISCSANVENDNAKNREASSKKIKPCKKQKQKEIDTPSTDNLIYQKSTSIEVEKELSESSDSFVSDSKQEISVITSKPNLVPEPVEDEGDLSQNIISEDPILCTIQDQPQKFKSNKKQRKAKKLYINVYQATDVIDKNPAVSIPELSQLVSNLISEPVPAEKDFEYKPEKGNKKGINVEMKVTELISEPHSTESIEPHSVIETDTFEKITAQDKEIAGTDLKVLASTPDNSQSLKKDTPLKPAEFSDDFQLEDNEKPTIENLPENVQSIVSIASMDKIQKELPETQRCENKKSKNWKNKNKGNSKDLKENLIITSESVKRERNLKHTKSSSKNEPGSYFPIGGDRDDNINFGGIAIESQKFGEELRKDLNSPVYTVDATDIVINREKTKSVVVEAPQITKSSEMKELVPENSNLVGNEKDENVQVSLEIEQMQLDKPLLSQTRPSGKIKSCNSKLPTKFVDFNTDDNDVEIDIRNITIDENIEITKSLPENIGKSENQLISLEEKSFSDTEIMKFTKPTYSYSTGDQPENAASGIQFSTDTICTSIAKNKLLSEEGAPKAIDFKSPLEAESDESSVNVMLSITDECIQRKNKTPKIKSDKGSFDILHYEITPSASSKEDKLEDSETTRYSLDMKSDSSLSKPIAYIDKRKGTEKIEYQKPQNITFEKVTDPKDELTCNQTIESTKLIITGESCIDEALEVSTTHFLSDEYISARRPSLPEPSKKKRKDKKSKPNQETPVQPDYQSAVTKSHDGGVFKTVTIESKPGRIIKTITKTIVKPSRIVKTDSTPIISSIPVSLEENTDRNTANERLESVDLLVESLKALSNEYGKTTIEETCPTNFKEITDVLDSFEIMPNYPTKMTGDCIVDKKEIETKPKELDFITPISSKSLKPLANKYEPCGVEGIKTNPWIVEHTFVPEEKNISSKKKKKEKLKSVQPEFLPAAKQIIEKYIPEISAGSDTTDSIKINPLSESLQIAENVSSFHDQTEIKNKGKNESEKLKSNETAVVQSEYLYDDKGTESVATEPVATEPVATELAVEPQKVHFSLKNVNISINMPDHDVQNLTSVITECSGMLDSNFSVPISTPVKKGSKKKRTEKMKIIVPTVKPVELSNDESCEEPKVKSCEPHQTTTTIAELSKIIRDLPPVLISASCIAHNIEEEERKPKILEATETDFSVGLPNLGSNQKVLSFEELDKYSVHDSSGITELSLEMNDFNFPTTSETADEGDAKKKKNRKAPKATESVELVKDDTCEPISISRDTEELDYSLKTVDIAIPDYSETLECDLNQTISPLVDIKEEIYLKKKKKDEKVKSSRSIVSPLTDGSNIEAISYVKSDPATIADPLTEESDISLVKTSKSAIPDLNPEKVDLEFTIPKEQFLDNSALKSKRNLRKRKSKRVSEQSHTEINISSDIEHKSKRDFNQSFYTDVETDSSTTDSQQSASERVSPDGITPDNIISEARRSGIFGSVMEKHYWMPESEMKKQNLAATALKNELQSIFSGDKKVDNKPVFKNLSFGEDLESATEVKDSPEGSQTWLDSNVPRDLCVGEKVSQKPNYIVRPTGEVVRELVDDTKTIPHELASSSSLTDELKLKLWFMENKNVPCPVGSPISKEITDHPTVWFANRNQEGSGFQQSGFRKPKIAESQQNRDFSKIVGKSSTLEDSLSDGNLHSTRSDKKSSAEEYLKKKVRKSVSDVAESIDNVKIQLENPSDFELILKTLDEKESIMSQIRSQLQEDPEIEEYQALLTEIEGVLDNLTALRSFVLSQCDQNQAKLLALNKRQSDLFKCSEMISYTTNWLTTTELKLASDDDTYLDDAVNENNIYRILSKEAGSNQLKIQECIHLCELYAASGDNDDAVKDLLSTLTHLQSEVRLTSKLLIERLEALQTRPKPVAVVTETVPIVAETAPVVSETAPADSETVPETPVEPIVIAAETAPLLTETSCVQTTPDPASEKEIQTSLAEGSVSQENAEAQTSFNPDLSQTNDTECSEDLSVQTSEDSLGSIQEPSQDEKLIIEITKKDIPLNEPKSKVSDTSAPSTGPSSEAGSAKGKKRKNKKPKKSEEPTASINENVTSVSVVEEIPQKMVSADVSQAEDANFKPMAKDSEIAEPKDVPGIASENGEPTEKITAENVSETKVEFSRLEDFEFATPSEYQDVTSTTSFSPVEIFTQDITKLSELKEKIPDFLKTKLIRKRVKSDNSEEPRTVEKLVGSIETESTVVNDENIDQIISTTIYSPSNANQVKSDNESLDKAPKINTKLVGSIETESITTAISNDENVDQIISTTIYSPSNADQVKSYINSLDEPLKSDEKLIGSIETEFITTVVSNDENVDQKISTTVYSPSNAVQHVKSDDKSLDEPPKTDKKLVASIETESITTTVSNDERVDQIISTYSPSNAETVSTSTQCSHETVSQGVQSSVEPIATKTDKSTLTRSKNAKKKAKRSETASLVQYVKVPTPVEAHISFVAEEDSSEKEDLPSSPKATPADDWRIISEKILLRIRNTNSVPYCSMYLKDSESVINTAEAINNFHAVILRIRSYLKCRDESNLRKSIAEGAEDVSNLLDDLNCQIFALKQSSHRFPLEEQISNLKNIKHLKTDTDEKCLIPLLHVIDESVPHLTESETIPCQELMKVLKEQSEYVDQAFDSVNGDSNDAYQKWCYFINEIQIMKEVMINMKDDLQNICADADLSIEEQLEALDELEKLNNDYSANLYELMMRTEKVIFHSPNYKMPDDVFTLFTDIKNLESSIPNKRIKLLQTASEIQDYENMLKLLTQIMDAAANNLLVFPVTVSSLPHLQDEMQKYRTFFVHLNHWKSLLETVQDNLDEKSRIKYFDMHAQVITRASEILDRGFYYSQKMALAASKWTVIRNGIAEENVWLESIENRFPDLSVLHSFDHERYSIIYSSLATDIYQKVTRISQLVDSAHRLCKEIACPELEFGYNKYKEDVISLRDNVNNDICILETFEENWNLYSNEKSRLLQWINSIESDIGDFDPVSDMQKFWWLQAKYESLNKLNELVTLHYKNALKLLKIQDLEEQQQIFDELQDRWQKLTAKITALQNKATEKFINTDIPVDQKLTSIEKELNELDAEFSNASEDAHSEEEFQFYCHKAQVMEKAAQQIENELKCYKLLTIPESEKVGSLINQAQVMAFKINEEVQYALSVEDYLKDINQRIEQVSKQQLRHNSVLSQCESCLGERQEDIDQALEKCEDLMGELQAQWHEITKLCQLFHTFPKRLKINVTLPTLEQQLIQIKNNQENLEDRCKILLNSLKERSALWKRFTDLKREVKECSEVIEFRTDLLSIHRTIDYRRLAAISENLQDLSESFDSRETDLLGELKSSAECLKLVCNEEVQNEIDYQVDESVVAWNDSRKSLTTLCERYENAVKIWANYRRNSDIVNEWVDDQLHSLNNLAPEEALNQVQVYSKALDEQSSKLSELRAMVMEIAKEVGIKEDNLFTDEIMLLSKKLEDVKSAITTINSSNEDQKCVDFMVAIEETEKCISSIKEDLQCNGENKSNQECVDQVQKLQTQLHSLSLTDATINNMKLEQAELLTNPENSIHRQKPAVTEILESWQQVFREAFRQYYRVFTTLAGDQDSYEALNLWKDYLENIQEFLRSEIPENYDNLSGELQICQLHESLLSSQNTILLNEKSKRTSPYLSEQMDALGNLHNETLSGVRSRQDEIKRRLDRWQIYRNEHNKLLSWLRSVEYEQSHLNLRYLYLATIDQKLNKIQDILKKVPDGILSANILKEQHKELLEGCGPGVRSSVRVELDAAFKRIQNLEAALKTWYEFLSKVKTTARLYDEEVSKIEAIFQTVHKGIENELCSDLETYNVKNLRNKIELIKNYEETVSSMDLEFRTLSEFEDQLKESIDIKETKKIKQKHWLLTQQQSDLKFQLSTHRFQLEEKIALWMLFDVRRTAFISWSEKLKKRLDQFSSSVNNPDVILRRMELEFCAEVESKQHEFDWFVETCSCLQQSAEGASEEDEQHLTIKIDELHSIWSDLNSSTKGRIEKIKSLIEELKSLEQSYGDMISWIHKKKGDLNKTVFFQTFDDSALQEKLNEHEAIEEKILSKSSEINSMVERGTTLIADCDDYNLLLDLRPLVCNQQSVEKSWRSLQMECMKAKENILTLWKLIQEVLSLCNTNKPWLIEQEKKLKSIEKRYKTTPLSFLQPLLSEADSISAGIDNHSTQFKLLEEMYSNLLAKNSIHDLAEARETLSRFANLKLSMNRLLKSLDIDLSRWKKYESTHSNLVLRLSQFDAKLTQLQHLDESNKEAEKLFEEKLQKLSVFETELKALKKSILQAETLKSDLSSKKKRNDSDSKVIQKMADEYLTMYKDIKKRIKTLEQYYRKNASSRSNVNEEVQVETLKFEQDSSVQVDTLPTSFERKDAFLCELQNTMKETRDNIEKLTELLVSNNMEEISKVTASCQSSVDLMKHLCAVLESQCDLSSTDPALLLVKELDDNFQQLLLKIRFQQQQQRQQAENDGEIGRLRCPLCSDRNWSQLNNDIWRLEKWLEHADATLQAHPPTPPEDIELLEDVIQEHKEFMMYLDSHHDLIVSLNIVGKHLMEHSQNEEQSSQLQERMAKVNEKWESISSQSLVWLTKLQTALMENNEFHAVITELLDWIEKTESSIKNCEPVDLLEERAVVEEKFRKFKKLHKELKRCEPRVASLQAANQVCASQLIEKLETSQDKLNHLRLRLQSLIRVTWLYMLKLGGVLGYDMTDMYASTLSLATPMTTSQEFLDESTIEPTDRPDSPDSTASNGDDENQSVLTRGHRFLGRVIRASLPIQAFIFVMLGVASLFPRVEEEFSCTASNNMAWSLEPVLRYPDGPPPT